MSGSDKDLFFDDDIKVRLRKFDVKIVKKIVSKNKGKYDSESHFYRAALLRLIRDEVTRLKL
jgi:Arc/MetJ-type ribon-helix-helix transcriptional regulator